MLAKCFEFIQIGGCRAMLDPTIKESMNLEIGVSADGRSKMAIVLAGERVMLILDW